MFPGQPRADAQIEAGVRISPAPRLAPCERRQHRRFPISAQAEYLLKGVRQQATALDISSGGVFLQTESVLPVGQRIKVMIDWPVLLDQKCPLRLVIVGRVLRSNWAGMAVGIRSYEFFVRPKKVTTTTPLTQIAV